MRSRTPTNSNTIESGDIVVTDQNAKALSQAPKPSGKPPAAGASQSAPGAGAATTPSAGATGSDQAKRVVRVIGTPFLSSQSPQSPPPTPPTPTPQPNK